MVIGTDVCQFSKKQSYVVESYLHRLIGVSEKKRAKVIFQSSSNTLTLSAQLEMF